LREGTFVRNLPSHSFYLSAENSSLLNSLIIANYETIHEFNINNKERKELLQAMILFYQLHISTFKEIKSQEILEEVIG
jgi:DNA repair protein RecO (recombination protein O)